VSYLLILVIAVPLYFVMRRLDFGRLSSQIVAVGGPGIGVISSYALDVHPLIGAVVLILGFLAMITILVVVLSAEIDD
jgi:hypothetical protein